MKSQINNLMDSKEYTQQLEQRKIDNINVVTRRLNEILNTNLMEDRQSFYISSGDFKTNSQFLLAEDILMENGWYVQHLFSQKDGDSMYVSLNEIV